ncbi:MAG: PVC-type heme-binding CxxCH protein, partial [Verrucomicrobiales bacterium]
MKLFATFLLLWVASVSSWGGEDGLQERVRKPVLQTINLLSDPAFADFTVHLNAKNSLTNERAEVWNLKAGELHVTGKGWGYLRTNQVYEDYHLVLDYQWAERIYGGREDKARDGGVLVHAYGPDGAFGDMFLSSFQAQLIEGGSGDLVALAARDEAKKPAPTRMTSLVTPDRNGKPVWNPAGVATTFPAENKIVGQVNWKDRDPDWKDVKGYRGARDIENPPGEWNRLEVICRGDTIRLLINGILVNEASGVSPNRGYVCLQSEAAEMRIRRWELWPLDAFKEKWQEESRSTDTGYQTDGQSILPRRFPLSLEESKAAWRIEEGYEIQLVAAEPLVCDPVDVVWDERGQMFVAEMGDYPLPAGEGEFLSRIRLLMDSDGDGTMDKATTWAGNLDHVQGLLPVDGGLVATTRTAILFLKDTDGDGRADLRQKLFEVNEPSHNQLQVSSPRWGLDNAIYFNNGLDLTEIYPVDAPAEKIDAKSRNLRYDPYHKKLTAIGGKGQFGGTIDRWNRHFFSTNRNPIIFAMMPENYAKRNPFAAITQVQEDIEIPGAKLHPMKLSHTTSVAHAGTYTAACGTCIYKGDLLPEMAGDIFVCDPTAQVVTRSRIRNTGAGFTTERIVKGQEFLASTDDWTRPVNLRNGPDGALYICDMYRKYIDHARFFPEDFAKSNYMRAGFDHGRIWRVVPKGSKLGKPTFPTASPEWVKALESENGWYRIHGQRILMGRKFSEGVADLLENTVCAEAFVHAFWLLHGQGLLTQKQIQLALNHESREVVENALQVINAADHRDTLIKLAKARHDRAAFYAILKLGDLEDPVVTQTFTEIICNPETQSDPWMRKAILSGSKNRAGTILAEVLKRQPDTDDFLQVTRELGEVVAAKGDIPELDLALRSLLLDGAKSASWKFALAQGIASGLPRSSLKQKSLSALITGSPIELTPYRSALQGIVDQAGETVLNRAKTPRERLAALPLANQKGPEAALQIAEKLIEQSEPLGIQEAACQALSRFNRKTVADFFFARWTNLGPTPRRVALDLIATNPTTALDLMKKMKAGEIPASIMPA